MAKRRRLGLAAGLTALGAGAAVAAGIAAERAYVRKDKSRPDPFATEPYGRLRGVAIGPVPSFDGTLLNVESVGEGPPVIFSHGFSLNLTLWHHQIKDLASDMRLVLFDHRGHGRSGLPPGDDFSLEALARDMRAVLSELDEPAILVGHSMGGMAVLKFCELYPDEVGSRVAGVVLVDTTAADVVGQMLPGVGRWVQASFQGVQEGMFRALAGNAQRVDRLRARNANLSYLGTRVMGFGRNPPPSQVAFVEALLAAVPSDVWLRLMPSLFAFDVSAALANIDVPALIIVGERDRLTPPGAARRMADAIAGADLVVLDDAGHTPMLEAADRFNALLRGFVARVRTASQTA